MKNPKSSGFRRNNIPKVEKKMSDLTEQLYLIWTLYYNVSTHKLFCNNMFKTGHKSYCMISIVMLFQQKNNNFIKNRKILFI